MKFVNISPEPRRIVGVVPDIDDERIVPGASLTVYHPFEQAISGGRVFVHTRADPYALVPSISRVIRELAVDQPVERAATLGDIRTEVLAPDRLNTAVFGLFAVVALAVAVVGVAGVLAFWVGGRTREFGIKLALGLVPERILLGVLGHGAVIGVAGIVLGLAGGYAAIRVAASYLSGIQMPGTAAGLAAGFVLLASAVMASLAPAARAARTSVVDALRAE
jgi:ABC-type antimicrobial peptide transport system permease subunit